MLENLLSNCGLNHSEQSVLLHLLKRGSTTATLISKSTGLKRPTVYAILDSLITQDLVVRQKKYETTYFSAVSPSMFPKILINRANRRYSEIQTSAELLKPYLHEFIEKNESNFGTFEISSFESIEAVYAMLMDSLLGGDFDAIFNPQTAQADRETVKIVDEFLKSSAAKKSHIREIVVSGPTTQDYKRRIHNPNHEIKEIPNDKKFLSDMILIDGAVVIIGYEKRRESAIKIIEPNFYTSMKTIFEMMWHAPA